MAGFVFSSDWHLAAQTWQKRPRIVADAFYSLQQIVDFCLASSAALLAAGDLLNKAFPDSAAVQWMCAQMTRMQEAGLPVYYIQGQHEYSVPPWMSAHDWPQHVHQRAFQIEQWKFYGLDWTPGEKLREELARIPPGTQFFMAHQVWMEHMGAITNPEGTVFDVPHAEYVLTGDYHYHQQRTHQTPAGPRHVVSPGSISIRNLGESPQKAFWWWDGTQFLSMPLVTRPMFSETLQSVDDVARLAQAAHEASKQVAPVISTPLVVVRYDPDVPELFGAIQKQLGFCELWYEEFRREVVTENVVVPELAPALPLAQVVTQSITDERLRGYMARLMADHTAPRDAVRALVLDLCPALVQKG